MKTSVLIASLTLVATSLWAADSAKDEVIAAAKKLADQPNYAWKTTTTVPEGTRFRPGPQEGQAEKDGLMHVSMTFGDNTAHYYIHGQKAAFTGRDGEWQSLSDVSDNEGRGQFVSRMVRNMRPAAKVAEDLVDDAKELKKEGDVYSGDLTEDGVKALASFGRRGGNNGPEITNPKGSVKFWITDGVLTKYEYKISGKRSFNGNDFDLDRTTTVEIKDIGKTKITVPAEAKRKLT